MDATATPRGISLAVGYHWTLLEMQVRNPSALICAYLVVFLPFLTLPLALATPPFPPLTPSYPSLPLHTLPSLPLLTSLLTLPLPLLPSIPFLTPLLNLSLSHAVPTSFPLSFPLLTLALPLLTLALPLPLP